MLAQVLLMLIGLFVAITPRAAGQCSEWMSGPFDQNSPGSDVHEMLTFDLDAGGPLPARLIAATSSGVWVWDNVNWRPLGEGLNQTTALGVFNGSLVAAAHVGDSGWRVVRWAGNGWVLMGGEFEFGNEPPEIRNLVVFSNSLFAGGSFVEVDGVPISRVARWNGSAWVVAGSGLVFTPRAMAVFDLDGAGPNGVRMIATGYSQLVLPNGILLIDGQWAQWTGTEWEPPQDLSFGVRDLLVVGDRLYACGVDDFTNSSLPRAVLGMWFSSSFSFGQNVVLPLQDGAQMNKMADWNGDVVAVGRFDFPGSDNVLVYDASSGASPLLGGQPTEQRAACVLGPNVVVARQLNQVAQCNGFAWTPVNSTGFGQAFATIGSRLVVGGNFTRDLPQSELAYNLVAWNGSALSNISPGSGTNGTVWALESFTLSSNFLIAGGDFTQVGSEGGIGDGPPEGGAAVLANRIAMWTDGLPNPGWSAMGNGFNGRVLAVERVGASQFTEAGIYAGGEFTAAGTGSPAFSRVAQWFGSTGSWSPMGTGFNGTVRALKGYNVNQIARNVIAGGDFTTAGGVAANRIAVWGTPGSPPAWAPMGSGFNGPVHAIERYNNSTYAAGAFTLSGATTVNRIARWSGTSWLPVGNTIGFNGTVRALLSTGEFLYAAGDFTSVDGSPADHIARWDGAFWADAGSDSAVPALALGLFHGEVHAGVASDHTSLRYLASSPWIIQQPSSQTVPCGQSVTFQTFPAPGYSGLTFTWRKNGAPLSAGPTGHGSSIALNHNHMTISNPRALDAGPYDCVLSSAECASVTTSTATLTVNGTCPPCPADTNSDGAVDIDDLLAVISAWGPCPAPPASCPANIVTSGASAMNVDIDDLLAVISAWGSCP